jgi:hypothetical protein
LVKKSLDIHIPRRFLLSKQSFFNIRRYIYDQRYLAFYRKPIRREKSNKNLEKAKRELNIHMYKNDDFEKRFGITIFKYIAILKEGQNSEEVAQFKEKIKNNTTFGRKNQKFIKLIKINNLI